MNLILYAVPFFLLAILLELVLGARFGRNTYRFADTINSLSLGMLSRLRGFLFLGVGGAAWAAAAEATAVPRWPLDAAWAWIVAFVVYDLCYYWSHRLGHEVNLLWASHVAHHQSEEYNLSTALRQTSTGLLTFVFYLPMFLVGVPAEMVVTVGSLNLIYQFWVHTRHLPKLGPLEWVFVTPSNHRVHHAQNDRYLDRNYGGVFIVWDRIFGTWQEELDEEPPVYGIRHALHSWNPLWANLHVYRDCLIDSLRTRYWRDKVGVWLRGPAWRPADLAAAEPRPAFSPATFERFEIQLERPVRVYVLVQFLLALIASLPLLVYAAALPGAVAAALAALAVAGFVAIGFWLEGRAVALPFDLARLAGWAAMALWLASAGFLDATLAAGATTAMAASAVAALWIGRGRRSAEGAAEPATP
jgi:sterol desaturase/sphingolipid hydroxylase (fatty acid hydroxylase superfamily)